MRKKHCFQILILGASIIPFLFLGANYYCLRTATLKDIHEYNKVFPHQQIPVFATIGTIYLAEGRSSPRRHDIVIFGELDMDFILSDDGSFLSSREDEYATGGIGIQEIISFPRCTEYIFENIRHYFDMRLDDDGDFYVPMIPNYSWGHFGCLHLTLNYRMLISKKTNKFILWIYEF